jgi:transposase
MGTDGAAVAASQTSSVGLSQSSRARPFSNECDIFVLRTGCQWSALNATGICSSTSAYRRFREWLKAGVFEEFWRQGLLAAQALDEIDWSWLSLDGAMTNAPLGGKKMVLRRKWGKTGLTI